MKINCSQFEGLITFYMDGGLSKTLKQAFEEHLSECPNCNMKYKIIKSIIGDIKGAYKKILNNERQEYDNSNTENIKTKTEDITAMELSAYIDNELSEENSIRVRRNIIAKPNIRTKLEKMYKLKKILSDSFVEHKNRFKTDYSKDTMRALNKDITTKQVCLHCLLFIFIVITAVILSIMIILSVI